MKFILFLITLTATFQLSAQYEGTAPLMFNQELSSVSENQLKSNAGTFDSTFIFTTDTISIPFFDEFSRNKIQQYQANFGDPNVTFDKKYRLLDLSDVPVANDVLRTTQITFRRTYDINTDETTDENFPAELIKVGELDNYPVLYSTVNTYPPFYIYDTIGAPDVSDTVWIVGPDIFQDSATQFFAHVQDPNALWIDDHAFHNYRFAVDPWSLGVMTFDGLDRKGYPYEMGTTLSGVADYLTSKAIDLTSFTPGDSIYLTFLVQRQGFGDVPEVNDSLVLEFYDATNQDWIRQWGINGGNVGEFKLGQIPVKTANFFSDAFQFRFKNYGALSGMLDQFHLDYVHLRNASGYQDTLIEDFAMVYPVPTLLKDFTSVPWDHYKNNSAGKMNPNTEVVVRNSYLNGGNPISSALGGQIKVSYNGTLETPTVNLNGQVLAGFPDTGPDYAPRTTVHSFHDVSAYSYDITKPGTQQEFDIAASASVPVGSFQPNDTAYSRQFFSNYYSYDDGTAEQAYFVTGNQCRIAIQYTPYEADSIIGMMVHFVPTVNDVSNKLFRMVVWADNGGVPGNVLYEDDAFQPKQPIYSGSPNGFVKYFTNDTVKVPVSGKFYIGWRQIDPDGLNVGLDKNIDQSSHTFYNIGTAGSWNPTSIPGSVMIRPIFSTSLDPELGIETKVAEEQSLIIYPNPSMGVFTVKPFFGEVGEISVYSLRGELVLSTTDNSFDLTNYSDGIYFVKAANSSATYKVIKGQ